MFYEYFILSCYNLKHPMRMTTLYHLLKGKKTSSVLSFGYFYDNLKYFGLFPRLTEEKYQKTIEILVDQHLLKSDKKNYFYLTEKGKEHLESISFPNTDHLNPFSYNKWDNFFWEKLLFTTQVISEKSFKHKDYVPIESNLFKQQQLKRWLIKQDENVTEQLKKEWLSINSILSDDEKKIIFGQLVGHELTGYTLIQLANEMTIEPTHAYLIFKNTLHYMMSVILSQQEIYPLMNQLILLEKNWLKEESSIISKRLFDEVMSISKVSQMRQLKESTVTDHLIEEYLKAPNINELPNFSDEMTEKLREFKMIEPDFRRWVYKEVNTVLPNLSFYEFRSFQFYLVEEERSE
ncbi:helix-turn-helix domain-containing protein [Vagococcus sp.]|uniref:helix-turn-helix domain-containing protein n=1 Tax=Vagococcus sp. TaxID=1933889 RepID=UPI002FC8F7EB